MPGVKVPKFLARAFGARELEPGLGRDACQKRVNSFLVRCFAAFGLHVRFPILRTYLRIDVCLEVPNENVSTNVPKFSRSRLRRSRTRIDFDRDTLRKRAIF